MLTEVVIPATLLLFAVQASALALWPLAWFIGGGLPDRGYTAAKIMGPLVLAYCVWLPSMLGLIGPLRGTLALLVLGLGALCWLRYGLETWRWVRLNWRRILAAEILFVGLYAIGVGVRMYNAAIIGQEKFMDMALLNAFFSAEQLPTDDPWMAGYSVPYYHFSYLLLASLGKLAGIGASQAYTLALVLVFALSGALAGALVSNVTALLKQSPTPPRQRWTPTFPALLGAFFLVICANLEGPLELLAARGFGSRGFWDAIGVRNLEAAARPGGFLPADGAWWFHTSRVIPNIQPDGISEFPYFSFLLGDLHPHYTALPLDLLVLVLGLNVLLAPALTRSLPHQVIAALSLGVLLVANTWDVPAFWGIYALCGLLAVIREGTPLRLRNVLSLGIPFVLAPALFLPYFVSAASPPLGLGLVEHRTPLVSMLILFGPLLVSFAFGLRWLWQQDLGQAGIDRLWGRAPRHTVVAAAAGALALVALSASREGTLVLVLILAFTLSPIGLGLFTRPAPSHTRDRGLQFVWLLSAMAVAILLGTELIYLSDAFASRMNTVFKFHYNAWLLLALAGAIFASVIAGGVEAISPVLRISGRIALTAAIVLGAVYPLAATYSKSGAFRGRPTLDGSLFLANSRPDDFAAIEWLRERAPARAVIIEAVGGDYSEHGRISTFSGAAAVMGWPGHEMQWRGPISEIGRRTDDVERVYTASDPEEVAEVLETYRVQFVIVGDMERAAYGDDVAERLASWLPLAFEQGATQVFRVPAGPGLAEAMLRGEQK